MVTPHSTSPNQSLRWPVLLAGMTVAGVVALSIHVVMLQVLGVPFPADSAAPAWARLLNFIGAFVATVIFCERGQPWLSTRPFVVRWLVVAAVPILLRETFRSAIMNGVVTGGWTFAAAQVLPGIVFDLLVGLAAVGLVQWIPRPVWRWTASVFTAVILTIAVKPVIGMAFGPWMEAMSHFAQPDRYQLPYPWPVMIPAYLSFAEPVLAAAILAALAWSQLSPKPWVRGVQFVVLLMMIRGLLLRILLYSAFIKGSLASALLSESQFTLEALSLGVLTAVTWQAAHRPLARRHSSSAVLPTWSGPP